ncbi:MAG TPA: HDOD domain-containing protein, partial [Acidimicrobiales bacterium]|nr:HDOD domain-containing protein [Acidimicrobiales bacterium]
MAWSRRRSLFRPEEALPDPPSPAEAPKLADLPPRGPTADPGSGLYVGRVPVLDHSEDLAGYQLVVESLDPDDEPISAQATITGALLEVGLDSLIGGRLGFVSVPPQLILDGLHHALPADRVVLELDPDGEGDPTEAARMAQEGGYHLAARAGAKWTQSRASRDLLSTVIVDVREDDPHWASIRIGRQHPKARLLADHVADSAVLASCWESGFWWARGWVIRRPDRVAEPTVPAQRLAVLELLTRIEDPRATIDDIDQLVSLDLGISYRLLRLANSSYLALERRVESTRDAVVYLGLDTVRAVAALMTMAATTDRAPALATMGLVRARTCQELADRHDRSLRRKAFT